MAPGVIAIRGPLLMPSESLPGVETSTGLVQVLPESVDAAKKTLLPAP
jgi:hypothetical protein